MKLTTKLMALMALAMLAGVAGQARAEETEGFPIQYNIETRQIHATHNLHNLHMMAPTTDAAEEIAPAILFPNGSEKLTTAGTATVKKVAALLKSPAYKGKHVLVSGYTDSTGKDATNQRLSYHRAVSVVKALVKQGVPASQLTAQGFGKEHPVADNSTANGRALNRRVTFTLGDKK